MPCYLFTYHAYGSWMPDREEGFVRRGEGVLPPDEELARQYRTDAKQQVTFDSRLQQLLVDEILKAFRYQTCPGHCVVTETTHVHVLVSWPDQRPWKQIRSGIKSSLTRRLNRDVQRRTWFVDSASRKRVKNQSHFDYLVGEYLPSHRGWKWREGGEPFR